MAKYVTNYRREGGKLFKDDARPAQIKPKDNAPPEETPAQSEPAVPKTGTKEKV